ncbi:RdgB/HAM1 family non-canonical purine NTP pyrophosphatase [Dyadobacter tibetensis]|uniref:RdgB/HAM1 family non-canonical purine NTP pyrophosphatase n=1 Tax=Dyadobacter tibetensis TaxID=1211851 RepID=UPI0004728BB3|nr:RdgB/HAM1 family non-canonical purine NTP pyrophosphatase [Dyadobacter tibetensis]
MNQLCFATNNQNKIKEIASLLGSDFTLRSLEDIGCHTEIPEPYDTIAKNSMGKARYVWEQFGVDCFADDTGLEVFALDHAPGVLSARYAGPQRLADDNMNLLLSNLAPYTDRSARFLTVITLVINGTFHQFEGEVIGTILKEKRGGQGFGYDPIFMPEGQSLTFAEMELSKKNTMSHRARAFAKLVDFLQKKS